MMLENLRFYAEEEGKPRGLSKTALKKKKEKRKAERKKKKR